jgi:phosphatidyl-myo-inositol alpha-mannosyltransferase
VRIGLVCPYDLSKPGGVQAQVMGLARRLHEAGDEPTIIGPGLPDGVSGVDLGPTVSIPGNRSRVPLSVDPRMRRLLRRSTGTLDLLHVHEPLMPMVSLAALRVGVPVVATFHAAPSAIGVGFYRLLGARLARVLGPYVRKVTAVSPTAAAAVSSDIDVVVIPNGVDVAAFSADVDRQMKRVAFLGRDEKRKGLDVVLKAWPTVIDAVPEAELYVMGANRDRRGITWRGPVDDAGKVEGLCSSAIYVAPNLGGESFGVVLVEAMAAGAAVVASDLPSFQDVGGDAVHYFETGDPGALAVTLVELLKSPEDIEELAAAGRARARRYDWETVAAQYRNVYREALS